MSEPLITITDAGLYCPAGLFHVDPWNPVDRAVITHAHVDHARSGCASYLAADAGKLLLRTRLGDAANITTLRYGEVIEHNGVRLSFHPAGHVLGSAQVRLEHAGEVWVITGDYKLDPDLTCSPFEPVRCHALISESTFGLPIYRWERPADLFASINAWWRANQASGKTSLLFAYALGKAQRILADVDASIGPIFTHGAVEKMTRAYRESRVALPPTTPVSAAVGGRGKTKPWTGGLVIGPPSASGSPWVRRFEPASAAFASGWMRVRGARRRKAVDRGFALSDHADWPGLLSAIKQSGAERVLVTHGFAPVVARYLRNQGVDAKAIDTRYGDEDEQAMPIEGEET